jgi:DNA-binding CsgD family transcriptional regulator
VCIDQTSSTVGLSPRFCRRFQGVCAECPHGSKAGRLTESKLSAEYALPPLADRAIAALVRCRNLTPCEQEVLTLCCSGAKNTLIAELLGISLSAVRRHLRNQGRKGTSKSFTCALAQAPWVGFEQRETGAGNKHGLT